VCVLDLPFAQVCQIFFVLTVFWTVICVTECVVKDSTALNCVIIFKYKTEIQHLSFCYDKIALNFL
jgi:hypothetical protein